MSHYEPKEPFDGYNQTQDAEYRDMMQFILDHETFQAKKLATWMMENFPEIESVADIGCGPGIYLTGYKEAGKEVFGIDACSIGGECLEPEEFERVDLRFPYKPKKRYDLAICFEVAEHLERHWSERLIYTLSDTSDLILFTAAVPGQGGTFHLNEQPHEFWIEMFYREKGYVIHPKQAELRAFLSTLFDLSEEEQGNRDVSGWLVNNCFLFVKENKE